MGYLQHIQGVPISIFQNAERHYVISGNTKGGFFIFILTSQTGGQWYGPPLVFPGYINSCVSRHLSGPVL
jgi:hypothetical protein